MESDSRTATLSDSHKPRPRRSRRIKTALSRRLKSGVDAARTTALPTGPYLKHNRVLLFTAALLAGVAVVGSAAYAGGEGVPSAEELNVESVTVAGVLTSFAVTLILTLFNGTFAMAETALVSVRPSRVEQLVEEKRSGALAVRKLISNPSRFIATTQAGITILGFGAATSAVATLAAPVGLLLDTTHFLSEKVSHTIAILLVTVLVSLLNMVLGEIAPKSIALQAPDVWALRLAPFISFCAVLLSPLTAFVIAISNVVVRPFGAKAHFETPMISRDEFERIIDQGEKHGEIDDTEAKIIGNVFDLSETSVKSVMTPRIDMTALSTDSTLQQTLDIILESGHSRIPVFEGTVDHIVGIVHAKDLLPLFRDERHDVDLRAVMRPPYFVPQTKRVSELLVEFRGEGKQIAIVQDEYAGTYGLITIEDVLEEIVGDIRDEYDVDEPFVHVVSANESLVDGRMNLGDVNDRLGTTLAEDEDYDTIGGLVFGLLGHEPTVGECVVQNNMEFVVEKWKADASASCGLSKSALPQAIPTEAVREMTPTGEQGPWKKPSSFLRSLCKKWCGKSV